MDKHEIENKLKERLKEYYTASKSMIKNEDLDLEKYAVVSDSILDNAVNNLYKEIKKNPDKADDLIQREADKIEEIAAQKYEMSVKIGKYKKTIKNALSPNLDKKFKTLVDIQEKITEISKEPLKGTTKTLTKVKKNVKPILDKGIKKIDSAVEKIKSKIPKNKGKQ